MTSTTAPDSPLRFRTAVTSRRAGSAVLAVVALLVSMLAATLVSVPASAQTGPLPVVEDFEGSVPITTGAPGIFPFGSDAGSTPTLSVVTAPSRPGADAGNHALDVPYAVTGYGGFSDDLAAAQSWVAYAGFSFWVKAPVPARRSSTRSRTAVPTQSTPSCGRVSSPTRRRVGSTSKNRSPTWSDARTTSRPAPRPTACST